MVQSESQSPGKVEDGQKTHSNNNCAYLHVFKQAILQLGTKIILISFNNYYACEKTYMVGYSENIFLCKELTEFLYCLYQTHDIKL